MWWQYEKQVALSVNMIDGRQKFFLASRIISQKRWLSSNHCVLILVVVGMCLCSVPPRGRIPAHCWSGGNRTPWECAVGCGHRRYARQDNITHYHHEKTQEKLGVFGMWNTSWEGREITGSLSLELRPCLDVMSCTVVCSFPLCLAVDLKNCLTQNHP